MTVSDGSFNVTVSCPKKSCGGNVTVVVTIKELKEAADAEEKDGKGYTISTHKVYDGTCDASKCKAKCRVSFAPVVSVWPEPS